MEQPKTHVESMENIAPFREQFGDPKVESNIADFITGQLDMEEIMQQNG